MRSRNVLLLNRWKAGICPDVDAITMADNNNNTIRFYFMPDAFTAMRATECVGYYCCSQCTCGRQVGRRGSRW